MFITLNRKKEVFEKHIEKSRNQKPAYHFQIYFLIFV